MGNKIIEDKNLSIAILHLRQRHLLVSLQAICYSDQSTQVASIEYSTVTNIYLRSKLSLRNSWQMLTCRKRRINAGIKTKRVITSSHSFMTQHKHRAVKHCNWQAGLFAHMSKFLCSNRWQLTQYTAAKSFQQ